MHTSAIGKQGQVDGNNFKSQKTGFAALGWTECFTSQWREFSADVVCFRPDDDTS
jgi:hypothetical protein